MLTAHPDLQQLEEPVSGEYVSGESLTYTDRYAEMERLAQRRSEQQYGDAIFDAQEPAWESLEVHALELAADTHDLRVGVYLTQGLLRTNGLRGFADGLDLLITWLSNEWDTLHPARDPDDGEEAIERSNILLGLCDPERTLAGLTHIPLAIHEGYGQCDLADLRIARGDSHRDGEGNHLTMHAIREMFLATDRSEVFAKQAHAERAERSIGQIVDIFQAQTGTSPNMSPVMAVLQEIHASIEEMMPDTPIPQPKTTSDSIARVVDSTEPASLPSSSGGLRVENRHDVVALLDELCAYYDRNEPSSPVPLLLQRTRQLVEMDFVDIVRNLAPDGLADVSRWVGAPKSRDEN